MPVYNEASTLTAAVKEILDVEYPCEVELVIVDDGSADGTRELYAGFESDPRVNVRLHAGTKERAPRSEPLHSRRRATISSSATRTLSTCPPRFPICWHRCCGVTRRSCTARACSAATTPTHTITWHVRAKGFGMEAEITGKLLRRGIRPYEVSISYKARTREAGKKLTWRDGVEALWILVRERFGRPS
jgi:dolichol-phosphate hexosyltransferase